MKHTLNRVALIAAGAIALPVFAQVAGPQSVDSSSPPGVSVPDSPGASEKLDKARDKENQKQWKIAAQFYSEAIAQFPGRVVAVDRDADKSIFRYEGIAAIVQDRLCKWPPDAIKIYNSLYAQTAADLLTDAKPGDVVALRNIVWNYFITDAGKTAAIRLMDCYQESGDFQAAVWMGQYLLAQHPSLLSDRPMVRYRTARAEHYLNHTDRANELLEQIRRDSPAQVSSIGGKDVLLVDSLTQLLSSPAPRPTTRQSDADTYPSFGGTHGRGEISVTSARPGASLNSVLLSPPQFTGLMGNARSAFQTNDSISLSNYQAMGIIPVVDNGSLFFNDGRCIYAVDADSGSPLTGWLNTYDGDRAGRYHLNLFGRARDEQLTLTVTPSSVLAIMGQPDHGGFMAGQYVTPPNQTSSIRLVCLDRDTGRERWSRTPAELPDSASALRTANYYGTPCVVPGAVGGDDSVLVIARGGKDNQFDDCYVVSLSLKTGQYRWSTYVGSATRNFDMEGLSAIDPSQICFANDRIFVATNLGSVASLDASDGRVIWLNSYVRDSSDNPQAMMLRVRRFGGAAAMPGNSNTKVWAHNPVIVSDGSVFVLPDDSRNVFIYDADTGEQQNRVPMSAFDNADIMLGVREGDICLTTEKGVVNLNWRKYTPDNAKAGTVWNEPDITGIDGSTLCGRGFVTEDSIFIPTKNRLIQKNWRTGKTIFNYPDQGSFTTDQGPGNVLVTARNVVVAGQNRVDVYTDLALVKQRFETAIAASPLNPEPRVKYADALFAGGQFSGAMNLIDQAIDLLGGRNSMRPGKERSMVFTTLLDFTARAEKNLDKSNRDQNISQENQLYDRAQLAADSNLEQASYRLARAHFNHLYEDYTGEVNLCQQILADPQLRETVMSDETTAGSKAETAITGAISANHASYAAVEKQAGDALQLARGTNDPQDLLNVATVYPNSNAAVDARRDAVHRFEAANQPDKAIDVLRRMYAGASETRSRVELLQNITADFLATPDGVGPAIDRLSRAARLAQPDTKLSQKLLLADGTALTDITLAQAVNRLRKIQADRDTAALPDFHLTRSGKSPFVEGVRPVIANIASLVHPLQDFCRTDQILTWSVAGLAVYPAGQTTPVFTIPSIDKSPIAAAWVSGLWTVWTSDQIFAFDDKGKIAWTVSCTHLPELPVSTGADIAIDDSNPPGLDDVNSISNRQLQPRNGRMFNMNAVVVPPPVPPAFHSNDEEISTVRPAGSMLIVTTSVGRVLSVDIRNGQIHWQVRPVDHAVDQLLTNPHYTVLRLDDPSGSQVAVYDTPTGRVIGRRRYGGDSSPRQLVNLALSEESTLAITLTGDVLVKDLYDPWKEPPKPLTSQMNPDATQFADLHLPDQLLVKGGRLVCLYAGGSTARGYDLSENGEPTLPLATTANTTDVSMQMVGSKLFIRTSNGLALYNLADKSDHFEAMDQTSISPPRNSTLLLGKDNAIMLLNPVDRGPLGSPLVIFKSIDRSLAPGTAHETGFVYWAIPIQSSAGITDWLGAQGTVYYLTKDGNVHVLQGGRKS